MADSQRAAKSSHHFLPQQDGPAFRLPPWYGIYSVEASSSDGEAWASIQFTASSLQLHYHSYPFITKTTKYTNLPYKYYIKLPYIFRILPCSFFLLLPQLVALSFYIREDCA